MQFREGVGQGRDRGIIGPKQVMNTQKNVNQENGSVLQYFADLLHQFIQNVPYVWDFSRKHDNMQHVSFI